MKEVIYRSGSVLEIGFGTVDCRVAHLESVQRIRERDIRIHLQETHTSFALDNGFFVFFAIEFLHGAVQICFGFKLHKPFAISVATNFGVNDIRLGLSREVFEILV